MVHAGLIAAITLWPTPVDGPVRGPLDGLLTWLHAAGVPTWVDVTVVEVAANVALFVPWGALVRLGWPGRAWWWATGSAAAMSVAVELVQLLALPARYPSVVDVVANTVGGALGWLLLRRSSRRPGVRPPPSSPADAREAV